MLTEYQQQILNRVKDEVARQMEFKDYEEMYLVRSKAYGLREFEINMIAVQYAKAVSLPDTSKLLDLICPYCDSDNTDIIHSTCLCECGDCGAEFDSLN